MIWQIILFSIMLIALWQLRKLSKTTGSDRRKKSHAALLFLVILACGFVLGRMWYNGSAAGSESFAHAKATVMARAQGWGLGRHIQANYPGQRVAVVADLDGMRQFATDFEQGFQSAGMENYVMINLTLGESAGDRPKLLFLTARDFNRATDQEPTAEVIVSLVGVPSGKLRVTQQKIPLLAAQMGSGAERIPGELQNGRIAGAISSNPNLAYAATPEFPSDPAEAFAHFFMIQTATSSPTQQESK